MFLKKGLELFYSLLLFILGTIDCEESIETIWRRFFEKI